MPTHLFRHTHVLTRHARKPSSSDLLHTSTLEVHLVHGEHTIESGRSCSPRLPIKGLQLLILLDKPWLTRHTSHSKGQRRRQPATCMYIGGALKSISSARSLSTLVRRSRKRPGNGRRSRSLLLAAWLRLRRSYCASNPKCTRLLQLLAAWEWRLAGFKPVRRM